MGQSCLGRLLPDERWKETATDLTTVVPRGAARGAFARFCPVVRSHDASWFGRLHRVAKGESHDQVEPPVEIVSVHPVVGAQLHGWEGFVEGSAQCAPGVGTCRVIID